MLFQDVFFATLPLRVEMNVQPKWSATWLLKRRPTVVMELSVQLAAIVPFVVQLKRCRSCPEVFDDIFCSSLKDLLDKVLCDCSSKKLKNLVFRPTQNAKSALV